jgi:molecular chaperone DnaK (HSP70)
MTAERLKEDLSSVRSARHVKRFGGAACAVELRREELENLTAALTEILSPSSRITVASNVLPSRS